MELSFLPCFILVLIIIPILQLHQPTNAQDDVLYETCQKQFLCGDVSITYPFYDSQNRPDYCGHPGFEVSCNSDNKTEISPPGISYQILSMNSSAHTITLVRVNYWVHSCLIMVPSDGLNQDLFKYTFNDENITLYYGCSPNPNLSWLSNDTQFSCPPSSPTAGYFTTQHIEDEYGGIPQSICPTSVEVAVNKSFANVSDINSLQRALENGFELEWDAENVGCDDCLDSGGQCGWLHQKGEFVCHCPASKPNCYRSKSSNKKTYMIVAAVIIVSSAIGTAIIIIVTCYLRRKSSSENQEIEAFLRANGPLSAKRYNYSDLKKIASSFKEKLGEGSYGNVYKGKLHNDHLVAVKLLKKSTGNDGDFINEVASIGRTNHVNVVTLLGFCFQHHKKALIYDYMPNGSLEKFIHRRDNHQTLAWEKLFEIAVGIARGLEYLHRGCNTRILHFDIKPHNILLDENFCPKISDFGLAKSCKKNDSIISMSGARGTVGFIAPEVFLRGFGGVSYKSDVYSYGMLVLDMVGRRKKANHKAEHSSEEYFPQWIYKELEQGEQVHHQGTVVGEDTYLQKKMILVSLWCIQTNPSSRPTMTKVVEMLEGTLDSLQHPPMPTLSSPLISQPNSWSANIISV